MSDKPIKGMREVDRRRKRVNRLKKTILFTVFFWMLFSLTAIIFLIFKCHALDNKLDKFNDFFLSASDNINTNNDEKRKEPNPDETGDEENDDSSSALNEEDGDSDISEDDIDENVKRVYLTFDDGPSANTDRILEILKEYNVKATFFVVGKTDEHSKEMYQKIVDEGHTLALHSYSHRYSDIYRSLDAYQEDINKLKDLLDDVVGYSSNIIRFPGGSSNQVSNIDMKEFIKMINDEGYVYFDWNVASGDATNDVITKEDIYNNVIDGCKNFKSSVVLMHDANNKSTTVEALPDIIEKLLEEEYMILPITEDTKPVQHISVEKVLENQ